MAPTRFTSGALITRNNFDALDGGFPGPRPRGRTSGRHTRAGFSFWRNDVPLAVSAVSLPIIEWDPSQQRPAVMLGFIVAFGATVAINALIRYVGGARSF